jgi:hypothetical protein
MKRRPKLLDEIGCMEPPLPADETFRLRVLRELQAADDYCRDLYGLRRRRLYRRVRLHPQASRPASACCVGCGCALDARTPGCKNCIARHEMRLRAKLDRLGKLIERAFG